MKETSTNHGKIRSFSLLFVPLCATLITSCAGTQTKPSTGKSSDSPARVTESVSEGSSAEAVQPEPGPNADEIVQVIRTQDSQMRQCYMLGSFRDSGFAGTVKVAFTIATSGRVSEVSDAGSDVADQEVVACVMDVFAQMEFRAGGVSPTEVTYPVNFGRPG